MKHLASILGALVLANVVISLPSGPPIGRPQQFDLVCRQLTPGHGSPAQPGNGGYVITTNLTFINATEGYSYVAGENASGTDE